MTKSVRIASVRIRSLTSWVVTTAPPAGSGSAWIASHVRGGPWSSTRRVVRSPRQAAARLDSMCSSTSTPMCVPCRIVGRVVAVHDLLRRRHRRRHRCRGAAAHRGTAPRPRRRRGRVRAHRSGHGAGWVGCRGRCRRGWKDRQARPIRRRPMPNPTATPMPMPTTRASIRPITVAPSLWDATTAPRWADRCRSRRRAASGTQPLTMYCVRSPMFTA